jgi:hypothetical protein
MVRNARSRSQEQKDFAERHRIEQGDRLAAVMVGTQFNDLQKLKAFPAALDRLGLVQASTTLMFLMGGEEALRQDDGVPEDETSEGIESLFNHMSAAAAAAGFSKPDYLLDQKVLLRSRVLGCEIAVSCENSLTSIGIGETILGTLESLLATSLALHTLPHLDRFRLRLQSKDDAPITPSLDFIDESGSTVAVITHRKKLAYTSREEAEGFPHWLSEAVIQIFLTFAVPAEPDTWSKTVLSDESGFSRAITFSNVPNMYGIIFGDTAKLEIESWSEEGDRETAITRTLPWLPKVIEGKPSFKPIKPGVGEPPEGMFDPEKKKHTDYRIISPIDARKWDSAIWRAVFFMCAPGSEMTPLLGLTFEQREPAAQIFEAWKERYGETDPDNNLRIAIITGVTISNPHAYAVIVGPNYDRIRSSPSDIVGFVARRNIMQPKSSRNLDMFLSEYHRLGRFKLIPAHLTSIETPPVAVGDLGLEKYDLVIRPAWTIKENDPDSCALDLDDPPVIPLDQPNAPVLKAMEQKAKFLNWRKKGFF